MFRNPREAFSKRKSCFGDQENHFVSERVVFCVCVCVCVTKIIIFGDRYMTLVTKTFGERSKHSVAVVSDSEVKHKEKQFKTIFTINHGAIN